MAKCPIFVDPGHTYNSAIPNTTAHCTHTAFLKLNDVESRKQVCDHIVERTPPPLQLLLAEAVPPQNLLRRNPILADARVAVLQAL